ncbi:MAG: sensor histidine kinase [Vicinamibacterales bacterium]
MSDQPSDDALLALNRAATAARLLSGAAHEVNNALQVISGTVELLEARPDLSSDVKNALERLRRQSTRAALALADVQHYTRADVTTTATVNLRDAMTRALALRAFAMKRAAITTDIAGDCTPLLVRGNRARLQQAAFNLLINAEQALAGKGGTIRVSYEAAADIVTVRVADEGPGLPAGDADRLFDPFVTTRPAGEGAGLGLWAARRIVEAHGGTLAAEPGPGAVFVMRLPRVQAPA